MLYVAPVLGSVCDPETYQPYLYTLFNSVCLETGGVGQPIGGFGHVLSGQGALQCQGCLMQLIFHYQLQLTHTVPRVVPCCTSWALMT